MFTTLIAAALSVQPGAVAEIQYRSHDVSTALKRGCKVQRVSVSGGRTEHAPIIRCPATTQQRGNRG
ncbi:hypothetical protein MZO42_05220 [Sphingomonas psychrotolerans]|uniref:Uncharacterized protein n=1 Tax=Sphingomonas psychrotolerans TaxID=1327635 RepID=A0ABU3N1F8_9SPHN|nr:hypothetical protein [Sphingomonas psychrotolerans]MDT8758091.1 hypothetical protein [Sphingomonas psychrotolerans]